MGGHVPNVSLVPPPLNSIYNASQKHNTILFIQKVGVWEPEDEVPNTPNWVVSLFRRHGFLNTILTIQKTHFYTLGAS